LDRFWSILGRLGVDFAPFWAVWAIVESRHRERYPWAFLAGKTPQSFFDSSYMKKADTIEDEGYAVVRFKSGAWLTLCITHIDANPKRGMLDITGTKGSYWWDYENHEITIRDGDRTVVTKGKNPKEQWENYYTNIADHLSKGVPLVITPQWARRPIHILDLANQSAVEGRALPARYV